MTRVFVVLTHDNRFINAYASRRGAEAETRTGRYLVDEVELPDVDSDRATPLARIRELSIEQGEEDLQEVDTFSYSWTRGHEELHVELLAGGGSHYRGVFHPGDGCCHGNPCRHCGRAVIE